MRLSGRGWENSMKQKAIQVLILVALIPFVMTSLTGCQKPPEEEMSAARQAVEDAGAQPDVRRYALQSLERARQLLSEMTSAAENREYDSARSLALEATDAAGKAVQDAANARERARNAAEEAVTAAAAALEEARSVLDNARNVRGIRFDFNVARREIEAGAEAIASAGADMQNESFPEAQKKAEDARASISDVIRRISEAVQAASRK